MCAVEWAELATLDLSKFDEPGGKQVLAKQLEEAIKTIGFFYIVNFGLSQDEVDRQFAIGKSVFELPTEEKLKYRADLEHGGYNGYKPLGLRVSPNVSDRVEVVKRSRGILIQQSSKSPPVSLTTRRSTTSPSLSRSTRSPIRRSSRPTRRR